MQPNDRITQLEAELLAARAEAARLAAALKEIVGLNGSAAYIPPHQPTAGRAIEIARSALAATDAIEWLDQQRWEAVQKWFLVKGGAR